MGKADPASDRFDSSYTRAAHYRRNTRSCNAPRAVAPIHLDRNRKAGGDHPRNAIRHCLARDWPCVGQRRGPSMHSNRQRCPLFRARQAIRHTPWDSTGSARLPGPPVRHWAPDAKPDSNDENGVLGFSRSQAARSSLTSISSFGGSFGRGPVPGAGRAPDSRRPGRPPPGTSLHDTRVGGGRPGGGSPENRRSSQRLGPRSIAMRTVSILVLTSLLVCLANEAALQRPRWHLALPASAGPSARCAPASPGAPVT